MFYKRPIKQIPDARETSSYIAVSQSGSYSPAQMAKLIQEGKPITSNNVSEVFFDGTTGNGMNLLPEDRRGIDVVDAWNISKDAKQKLFNAYQKDISENG